MFRCEGVLEYGERLSRSGIRKPYRLLISPSGDQLNPVSMVDTTLLTKLDSLISNNIPVTVERLEGKRTRDNPQITVSQGFSQSRHQQTFTPTQPDLHILPELLHCHCLLFIVIDLDSTGTLTMEMERLFIIILLLLLRGQKQK